MLPCHTMPFMLPGTVVDPTQAPKPESRTPGEACDYCGSPALVWRKCKLLCAQCRQINKSCADL
jgi:hypothetical protein